MVPNVADVEDEVEVVVVVDVVVLFLVDQYSGTTGELLQDYCLYTLSCLIDHLLAPVSL